MDNRVQKMVVVDHLVHEYQLAAKGGGTSEKSPFLAIVQGQGPGPRNFERIKGESRYEEQRCPIGFKA